MIKLSEKTRSVFLYSKDGSKNDAPVKAFGALKAALGDTALTAENFKQFATGFQEFVSSNSVHAAPALDNADPNAENAENTENTKIAGTAGTTENTQDNTGNTGNTETASISGMETTNTGNTATQQESAKRIKPSSLLSLKN